LFDVAHAVAWAGMFSTRFVPSFIAKTPTRGLFKENQARRKKETPTGMM